MWRLTFLLGQHQLHFEFSYFIAQVFDMQTQFRCSISIDISRGRWSGKRLIKSFLKHPVATPHNNQANIAEQIEIEMQQFSKLWGNCTYCLFIVAAMNGILCCHDNRHSSSYWQSQQPMRCLHAHLLSQLCLALFFSLSSIIVKFYLVPDIFAFCI